MGRTGAARCVLALSGAAIPVGEASASAWARPPGDGQTINTISVERGDFGETWRFDDLIEFGLTEGWEGNLKIDSSYRYHDFVDSRLSLQAGVKRSFAIGERSAVAVQGSILGGQAVQGVACNGLGFETRVAAGTSFDLAGRNAFANVEGALRTRGEGCDRTLAEATLGVDLFGGLSTIAKVWTEQGSGSETVKAEGMLLWTIGGVTLALGYREEVSGAYDEGGLVAGYWSRF